MILIIIKFESLKIRNYDVTSDWRRAIAT